MKSLTLDPLLRIASAFIFFVVSPLLLRPNLHRHARLHQHRRLLRRVSQPARTGRGRKHLRGYHFGRQSEGNVHRELFGLLHEPISPRFSHA
jgi:hypothetical protein